MMQKMGWKGAGLGSQVSCSPISLFPTADAFFLVVIFKMYCSFLCVLQSQESGITEPISGGEVRDKQDQYKGMGIEKVIILLKRKWI